MPDRSTILMTSVTGLWLLVVGSGLLTLLQYSYRPGSTGDVIEAWPDNASLRFTAGRPNLIMFLHPKCPCSRASVREFEEIVARHQDALHSQVVFVRPQATDAAWVETKLWESAVAIPGVAVSVDHPGQNARQFGALTSGHTFLFAADRSLVFSGGITSSRGHEGDNVGCDSIGNYLQGGDAGDCGSVNSPVFGCPLFSTEDGAT